ncbi:hypothetical protein F5B19DRAFT_436309, partial [Rostrohypoxylon terebratum]
KSVPSRCLHRHVFLFAYLASYFFFPLACIHNQLSPRRTPFRIYNQIASSTRLIVVDPCDSQQAVTNPQDGPPECRFYITNDGRFPILSKCSLFRTTQKKLRAWSGPRTSCSSLSVFSPSRGKKNHCRLRCRLLLRADMHDNLNVEYLDA